MLTSLFEHVTGRNLMAANSWDGVYQDPMFNGKLKVCVSNVDGEMWGQGVFSEVGYMRGKIERGRIWSGTYYIAGEQGQQGHFSYKLDGSKGFRGHTVTGPGKGMRRDVKSKRKSSATPSDEECFRSSNSLLKSTTPYSIMGVWDGGVSDWGMNGDEKNFRSSYWYELANDDASGNMTTWHGYEVGKVSERGQVMQTNFYEEDEARGIDLIVAKDATHLYSSYWTIFDMNEFDHKNKDDLNEVLLSAKTVPACDDACANHESCKIFSAGTQEMECIN